MTTSCDDNDDNGDGDTDDDDDEDGDDHDEDGDADDEDEDAFEYYYTDDIGEDDLNLLKTPRWVGILQTFTSLILEFKSKVLSKPSS